MLCGGLRPLHQRSGPSARSARDGVSDSGVLHLQRHEAPKAWEIAVVGMDCVINPDDSPAASSSDDVDAGHVAAVLTQATERNTGAMRRGTDSGPAAASSTGAAALPEVFHQNALVLLASEEPVLWRCSCRQLCEKDDQRAWEWIIRNDTQDPKKYPRTYFRCGRCSAMYGGPPLKLRQPEVVLQGTRRAFAMCNQSTWQMVGAKEATWLQWARHTGQDPSGW